MVIKQNTNVHLVTQYALDCIDARHVVNKLVLKAAKRHMKDLKTGHLRGIYFDEEKADHACNFFPFYLRHSKGSFAGKPFELQPWQVFIVGSLFGWMKKNGLRRFSTAYIELARKNGKSTLAAGIGLYMLIADGEEGSEVYCVATKEDQAMIVLEEARRMVMKSPELRELAKVYRKSVSVLSTFSKMEPLGADSDTQDGLNIHCAIIDEVHKHKNSDMVDVIDTATGSRDQALIVEITTAGTDQHSICYAHHEHTVKVVNEIIEDDSWFGYIATVDNPKKWQDETEQMKANPNWGISVNVDTIRKECNTAKNMPAKQNPFKRYKLNIWTEQKEVWITAEMWNKIGRKYSNKDLKDSPCYIGMDLSTKLDITAVAVLFPPYEGRKKWWFKSYYFAPEDNILEREKTDKVPYRKWKKDGHLITTPGNVIDYDEIRNVITDKIAKEFSVQEIGFDPYNATQLSNQLIVDGFECWEVRQGTRSMGEPSKEFEAMVTSGKLQHDKNPVTAWMMSNTTLRFDTNGNYMPEKASGKTKHKIDGIVALIIALARAIVTEAEGESVYETRGLIDYEEVPE